ncbi:helix-turn-helix domain-containing protein [Salinimicrobium catena]|uniref:helix-turn-helix transcriptional regulator n=1 Tax=Salinimicrobium catena TaxID=390640 RepID=UPI002FE4A4F0
MKEQPLELYTKSELAEILNVNESSIYNYVTKGIIKAYKMKGTRRIYFKKAEVEATLTEIDPK